MPRSTKESEDEVETKSGRRTRASALSVTDSPLRRSSRRKPTASVCDDNSSPESMASDVTLQTRTTRRRTGTLDSVTSETTRSLRSRKNSTTSEASEIHESENEGRKRSTRKSSLVPTSVDTPTKTRLKRSTRAGSESKTMSPVVRITRRTRASSVDPEVIDDRPSSNTGTPVKGRKQRGLTFPSEPSVIEETVKLSKQIDNLKKTSEIEDDDVFVIETTNTTGNSLISHESTDSPKKIEESITGISNNQIPDDENVENETREALEDSLEALISQTAPEEDPNLIPTTEKQKLVDNANDNTSKDLPKVLVEKTQLLSHPLDPTETSPGNKENDVTYAQKKKLNTARRSSGSLPPRKSINIILERAEVDRRLSLDEKSVLSPKDSPKNPSKSLNPDNLALGMASVEPRDNEIIFIDDTDTDEADKSLESSRYRRKSLKSKKSSKSDDEKKENLKESKKSPEKTGNEEKIGENLDPKKGGEEGEGLPEEHPELLFKDISAEEWKKKSEDDKADSDADCDLILVGKGGWSADEADDDDEKKNDYDSDATVIVAKKDDLSDNMEMSKINEEMEVAEDEEDTEIEEDAEHLSSNRAKNKQKSTRKSEMSEEKRKSLRKSEANEEKRKSTGKMEINEEKRRSTRKSEINEEKGKSNLNDSVEPMEVDDDDDDDDKDSEGFVISSRKQVDGDSSDDEASESDARKSAVLENSGKLRRRTSSGEARRSMMRSRSLSQLVDTDTSTDEEEEGERRRKMQEAEEMERRRKMQEVGLNRSRKSLSGEITGKKGENEGEVGEKDGEEVNGPRGDDAKGIEEAEKIRKSLSKELRRSLRQEKTEKSSGDENPEDEDYNKLRKSLSDESRKPLTQIQNSGDVEDEGEEKRALEAEEKVNRSRKSFDELRKSFTRRNSLELKEGKFSEDEEEDEVPRIRDKEEEASGKGENQASPQKKELKDSSDKEKGEDEETEVPVKEKGKSKVSDDEKISEIDDNSRKSLNKPNSPQKSDKSADEIHSSPKKSGKSPKKMDISSSEDEKSPEKPSDDTKTSKTPDKSRKSLNKTISPIKTPKNHEESQKNEEIHSSPKKSLKSPKKIETESSSSEEELEEPNKVSDISNQQLPLTGDDESSEVHDDLSDDSKNHSLESAETETETGKSKKTTHLFRNASTIVQVNSESEVLNSDDDDDDENDSKKLLPSFLYDADTTESSNSDIEKEYNLNGDDQVYSDDDVPFDECRESESSEEDDEDDDDGDLSDLINDEEEEEEEEEEEMESDEMEVETVELEKIKEKSSEKTEKSSKIESKSLDSGKKKKILNLSVEEIPKALKNQMDQREKGSAKSEKKEKSGTIAAASDSAKKKKKMLNFSGEIPENSSKIGELTKIDGFKRRQTMLEVDPVLADTRSLMKEKLNESLPTLKSKENEAGVERKQKKKKKTGKSDAVPRAIEKLVSTSEESDSDEIREILPVVETKPKDKNVTKKANYLSPMIKKPIKRLPEEILENISDIPQRPKKRRKINSVFLPTRKMFKSEKDKPKNMEIDEEFIPISLSGGTTQFEVVNLAKKKEKKSTSAKTFRERAMNRVQRQPMSAYFVQQQKRKAAGKF